MSIFDRWRHTETVENPSAEEFIKVDKSTEEDKGVSVTAQQSTNDNVSYPIPGADSLRNFLVAPVSTNKSMRLNEYRMMSNHVEVSDAIDEISDSIFNLNENGRYADIRFRIEKKFKSSQQDILRAEFDHIMSLFDFELNGFKYARIFVVEGELTFENVIDPKNPKKGILSVRLLENDKYELLKDLRNGEPIGIFLDVSKKNTQSMLSPDYAYGSNFFREIDVNGDNSTYVNTISEDKLPLLFSQITYINTGVFDKNKTFVFPPLDRARQAYKQLTLVEDGVIIYRVARSPERLVFNVASGNTAGPKAQQQLQQMIKRFNMRKSIRNGKGRIGVANSYDAHQVLESFWFLKPEDSQGSSVESIGGQAQFGELEDLKFFTRKLYRSMKVPFSRFEQPENTISQGEDITYEEYKFAKFIVRLQSAFASAIRDTFYTHLKLKGLWEKYGINEKDIKVKLMPPALYELYQTTKLNEMRMEAYSSQADDDNFSYTLAQRKILNWSEEEIQENKDMIFKEAMDNAEIEFWTDKIGEYGSYERAKKEVEKEFKGNDDEGNDDN